MDEEGEGEGGAVEIYMEEEEEMVFSFRRFMKRRK